MADIMNNGFVRWFDRRLPILSWTNHHLIDYPAPRNLNYMWNFGSLAGLALVIQIVTGIVLAMHYTPHADMAFDSVERIMRDVEYGWLMRYAHANGASFFFIVVYLHVFRGLYYGSYKAPREVLWWIGLVILLAMMATAFMGYVLPWGQMSYWAATVITNLLSALPVIGGKPLSAGCGAVFRWTTRLSCASTPFISCCRSSSSVWWVSTCGRCITRSPATRSASTPPDLRIPSVSHPYYTIKDAFGAGVFLLVFAVFLFYAPNYLGHPDNYIPADPLKTPAHIVPEWYFLPFYAILRAIPSKLGGAVAMALSIGILFLLPWLDTSRVRSAAFRPVFRWFFWILVIDIIVLGVVGANPPEGAWIDIGRIATAWYFLHFLILLPLIGWFERPRPLPASIASAVLDGSGAASERRGER